MLGVRRAITVTLIAPGAAVTGWVVPAENEMTVVGTFDSGHFEYDSLALVMLHQTIRSSASKGPRHPHQLRAT
jgi:lipoprotein-releasing system permease protein